MEIFGLLLNEHLQQTMIFKEMVDVGVFYRN